MFDRDEQEISQIIETGLEVVASGRTTLDEFVAEHPGQAAAIRPEVEAALWLTSRQEHLAPRPGFMMASRRRVVERIKQEARSGGTKHAFFGFAWPRRVAYQWTAAILLVIFILSGTGGAVTFAQRALPGDGLYGIKRITEDLTFAMTPGPAGKADLNTQFSNRRLDEVAKLIETKKYDEVQPTLDLYEQQAGQAVFQLQRVTNSQPEQKKELALAVKSQLALQAERLATLQALAPASVGAALQEAKHSVGQSASAADKVIEAVDLSEKTKTPADTSTPADTDTPTAGATDTDTPTAGATDTTTPDDSSSTAQDPDAVLEEPSSASSTVTPADSAKKVKTPKPPKDNNGQPQTNPQKPGDKPPKDNNSNPGNNNPPKDNGPNGSSPPKDNNPSNKPPKK